MRCNRLAWSGDGRLLARGGWWWKGRCDRLPRGGLRRLRFARGGRWWKGRCDRLMRGGLRRLRFARGGAGRDRLDRGGLRGAPARRKLGRSPALPRRQRWWYEQINYQGLKLSESRGEVAYLRGQFRYVGGAFRSCGARRGWGSVIQSGSAVDAEGTVTRRLPATIRTGPRRRHVGIHLHLAAILKSLPPNYPIPLTAAGGAPMGTLRGRLLHFRDAPPKGGVLQR